MGPDTYKFVSVNRRNNEARALTTKYPWTYGYFYSVCFYKAATVTARCRLDHFRYGRTTTGFDFNMRFTIVT